MMKRDLIGYGMNGITRQWPNNARLAISFVINYEEGAELTPVNGDLASEVYGGGSFLSMLIQNESVI